MSNAEFHRSPVYYWHPSRWRRSLENQVWRKALRDRLNTIRYGHLVPPSDVAIFVDPAEVTHGRKRAAGDRILRRRDSGRVVGGNWDLRRVSVEETLRLISCRMRYEQGADWQETPQYQRMCMLLERGETPDECRSVEDIDARYAALDRLVEETRARGRFLTREELPECFRREHGGIFLHLARDGSFLRAGGGGHRFAIAKVLNLPEMPAQLGVIHRDALRDGHVEKLRLAPRIA